MDQPDCLQVAHNIRSAVCTLFVLQNVGLHHRQHGRGGEEAEELPARAPHPRRDDPLRGGERLKFIASARLCPSLPEAASVSSVPGRNVRCPDRLLSDTNRVF